MLCQPLEPRWALSGFGLNNCVYRSSSATAFVDVDHNGTADHSWVFGVPGDRVVAGDLNQDGLTDLAVYRSGAWFVDISRDGVADLFFGFGGTGDTPLLGDVNNDGATDLIIYRPSSGAWFIDTNLNGQVDTASPFGGLAGDLPVVGDFNGDARLDRAIYRPSLGRWYVDFGFLGVFGAEYGFGGDPRDLPFSGDYNDDGLTDIGIYRDGTLFVSANRSGQVTHTENFGVAADRPWPGYYDFRRVVHAPPMSMAVFRPGTATIFTNFPTQPNPNTARVYGAASDLIATGDFNGNTVTDVAIFRNGGWHIDFNRDGTSDQFVIFGQAGDIPLGGDVNNDGAADLIVFRNGTWFVSTARNGQADLVSGYGQQGDLPAVGDLNADGVLDRAIYRQGTWHIDLGFNGTADSFVGFGGAAEDKPFLADFNNDRKADLGIFRDGTWFIDTTRTGRAAIITSYGIARDVPIPGYYDTFTSLFVRQGASGAGTEANPFGTIQAAVNAAVAGSIIRIGGGAYGEQVNVISKTNVTLVGASRHFLNIRPNVGNSMNVTLSSNIYLYDMAFNAQDATNGSGRGIQVSGSSLIGWGIRTNGVRRQGIYTAAPPGQLSYVEIHDSHLDESQMSAGFFSEQRTVARLFDTRVDSNGTGSGTPADQFGRGLVFTGNSVATLAQCLRLVQQGPRPDCRRRHQSVRGRRLVQLQPQRQRRDSQQPGRVRFRSDAVRTERHDARSGHGLQRPGDRRQWHRGWPAPGLHLQEQHRVWRFPRQRAQHPVPRQHVR